ncbi:lactate permease LctP family transporter [Anaerobiospirillum sp. NML120448]|uniref:lactate permease LctP family transporter n=1 Tax=Anaerobiospirillum sp. NML120448 TaxID=2932816 RepID=UPI001FF47F43|nr:lactate permease LctP family transporter [Anaerobiospirillum sp. NML120448]MCK0514757.1 lactate permease LctP family transporter [Anaerobiospirillum sp. NML120448]
MWIQNYDPAGSIWLSALVAALPIICFLLCLVVFKLKGYQAGFITVFLAALVAIFFYDMPAQLVGASFVQGYTNGMWPIAWIIVAAIFLYKLSVKSGSFEIIKQSVISITPDHRIQVLLIGFCFGSFLEGAIGFGGPVAITAALLVGLGLKPLYAAGLCLIANTAPVAFGAVGIPITAMTDLVGVDQHSVSAMVGRLLFPLSLTVPFFIVFLMDGFKGVRETFPAVLVTSLSFAVTQYYTSNHIGAQLPDITSAVVALVCTTVFLKWWQPKNIFRLDDKTDFTTDTTLTFKSVFRAWVPFLLLIILIIVWTNPLFLSLFAKGSVLEFTQVTVQFNATVGSIKSPDVLDPSVLNDVKVSQVVNLIAFQAGTAIFIAALLTIVFLRIKTQDALDCFWDTLKEMAVPIVTIGLVVAFAFIAKNSGMSTTLGLAFASTGSGFAFFSPIIGWIGVFLTGSDTSSNLLFGILQQASAKTLGIGEALFLAANSVGGVVGKMISPQSIAIACAAVGLVGRESELFKFTLKYSLAFILIIGIWIFAVAFFFPWMIPEAVPLKH